MFEPVTTHQFIPSGSPVISKLYVTKHGTRLKPCIAKYLLYRPKRLWILNSWLVIKLDQILHRLPVGLQPAYLVADLIIATPLTTDQEQVHMSGNEVGMVL